MASRQARLDRFLSASTGVSTKALKWRFARGEVLLNGEVTRDPSVIVGPFDRIECGGSVLQDRTPRYLMLNKPAGIVSATQDARHTTVVDLLGESASTDLHIVGRLDFNSTGLLLLTNDGRWSRALSLPGSKVAKRYRVTLAEPVTQEMVSAFAEGMYFSYEQVTTLPAELIILGVRYAEVVLHEGRYHQIKRMFGRFQNEVLSIHRIAVGHIRLDERLLPGEFRALTDREVMAEAIRP